MKIGTRYKPDQMQQPSDHPNEGKQGVRNQLGMREEVPGTLIYP